MDRSLSTASRKASLVVLVLLLAACNPMTDGCQTQTGCQATVATPGSTSGSGSNTSPSDLNANGYSNGGLQFRLIGLRQCSIHWRFCQRRLRRRWLWRRQCRRHRQCQLRQFQLRA